jgi:RNA polymerase sigma-70 factor (ECF subfamily)
LTAVEYNRCVDEHADGVYRFILHHCRDENDARDVVQDSFEKMWLAHAGVNYEKAKSYLFTTAYRTMIDRIRKNKRQEPLDAERHDLAAAGGGYSGLKELLREGLGRLPEIQKSVVMLRDYEGYSYEEIGEITGLSASQVKVYIYRARTALKEYIGKMSNVI